jgi:hypothetical protein
MTHAKFISARLRLWKSHFYRVKTSAAKIQKAEDNLDDLRKEGRKEERQERPTRMSPIYIYIIYILYIYIYIYIYVHMCAYTYTTRRREQGQQRPPRHSVCSFEHGLADAFLVCIFTIYMHNVDVYRYT